MSEFDELIGNVANGMRDFEIDISCQKTLKAYQGLDSPEPTGHGGGSSPLKMIAWDRS